MTKHMEPFRQFLKPNIQFRWDTELESLFSESKQVIVSEINKGVRMFDKSKPTCLATDWSKTGIGFWLFQKHCTCPGSKPFCCQGGWQIALVGSRFTHAAESRYAPIEGEALAVADALERARFFVLGCSDLIVVVDHKPLLRVFTDRSLEAIANPRLQNLKEKTLRYRFRMMHIPGARHRAADAMSRHPTGSSCPPILELPDDVSSIIDINDLPSLGSLTHSFLAGIRIADDYLPHSLEYHIQESHTAALNCLQAVTWDRVRLVTASDPDMNQLVSIIKSGMPSHRHELPTPLRDYHQFRNDLYTVDGVVIYKERVVIPPSLREEVLAALHAAHLGGYLQWWHVLRLLYSGQASPPTSPPFGPGATPATGCHHMLLQGLCSISYPLVNSNWSYSPETPNLGQIRRFLEPCDLQIWRMTLKNNRAPLLCHFKLCVSFHTHWWIQIWDTVRKHFIRVKIDNFLSRVT